jgi:predicted site-specific integrase-resolvase
MSQRWLTSDEVAELLRVRPATVAQWRWRRRGPAFVKLADGPAGKVRYERREVERWMKDPVSYQKGRSKH